MKEKKHIKVQVRANKIIAFMLAFMMVIGFVPVRTFAEVEKANWNEKEILASKEEFWPVPKQAKVEEVGNAEPIRNFKLKYIGTYTNTQGRTVVRTAIAYRPTAITAVWKNLQVKVEKDLFEIIDWNNNGTGIIESKGITSKDWVHDGYTVNDNLKKFSDLDVDVAGAYRVKTVDIKQNGNLYGAVSNNEIPVDFVLKDGQTLDGLNNPIIQTRLTNSDNSKIYSISNLPAYSYGSYTATTFVPTDTNYDLETVEDIQKNANVINQSNGFISYNEEKGYVDVYHVHNKVNTLTNNFTIAFRQIVDSPFYQVLRGKNKTTVSETTDQDTVAEVFITNENLKPYKLDSEGNVTSDRLTPILKSNLNYDGKLGYVQVASGNMPNDDKIKTVSLNGNRNDNLFNASAASYQGFGTVVRYYVDKVALDKLVGADGINTFRFYESFLINPSDFEHKAYKFEGKIDKERNLKSGTKVKLTFDQSMNKTSDLKLVVGNQVHNLDFVSRKVGAGYVGSIKFTGSKIGAGKNKEWTWTVPLNIKLKANDDIKLYVGQAEGTNVSKVTFEFDNNDRFELTTPKEVISATYVDRSDILLGGVVARTHLAPNVDEIFTDSKKITGASFFSNAEIAINSLVNGEVKEQKIGVADTQTDVNMHTGKTEKGYVFDTTLVGKSIVTSEAYSTFTMPRLEKDMPIAVNNTDIKKLAMKSKPPVIEQVQAKVKFDLNGGSIGGKTETIEKIAPLNQNYLYKVDNTTNLPTNEKNDQYKPNGFEGDNRKLVDGVVADHNGLALTGEELAKRQFPENPVKDGLTFLGWSTKKIDKTPEEAYKEWNTLTLAKTDKEVEEETNHKFDSKSPISKEITLYAVWGKIDDVVPQKPGEEKPVVPDNYVKVEFSAGQDGKIAETETKVFWVNPKVEVTLTAPAVTPNDGFKQKAADQAWDKSLKSRFTEETTITAQYDKLPVVVIPNPGDENKVPEGYAKVSFNDGIDGKFATDAKTVFFILKGKTIEEAKKTDPALEIPSIIPNEGKSFDGWDNDKGGRFNTELSDLKDPISENTIFTARYSDKPIVIVNPQGDAKEGYVRVIFEATDKGSIKSTENKVFDVLKGKTIQEAQKANPALTIPKVDPDQGYEHIAWKNSDKEYKVDLSNFTTPLETRTEFHAKMEKEIVGPVDPNTTPNPNKELYATVTFKPGDNASLEGNGTFYVLKSANKTLADIKDSAPTVKPNEGFKFVKWNPELDANTKITNDLDVNADVYKMEQSAKPEIKQPAANDKTIFVNVPAGTSKGKMTVTVTPKDGSEAYTIDLNTTDNVHYDGQVPAGKTLKTGDKVDATFTEDGKNPTNADPKTVESHLTDKEVIPYEPSDPKNPTDDNDPKIPNQDENGKIVEKGLYNIIGFKTEDRAKGTLTLAELIDKESISVLVKKGLTWEKVTVPTPKAKENNVFWMWSPLIPEKTANVENGNVYEAKFLTNGQEVEKDATLPDGVFKVTVSKDQASIKDNDLFGKTYAVFKDTKLSQDKFPALEANDGFKDPKWNEENPWDKVITSEIEFKASATNAKFDNNNVVEVVIKEQPTLSYNEGNKLDLSKLVVTLKDKNGNTQDVPFDKFNDYGLTTNPVDKADLTVQDHNNKPVVVTHSNSNKTANTENLAVKPNSTENVIPYNPIDPKNPTDDNDNNIPKVDKDGKNIVRSEYIVVAFNVTPENSGTLTLGDVKEQSVISALVKKDTKWSDVKLPETKAAEGYAFWYWSDAKGETVADKEVRTARFINSGDEITPADKDRKLPENFYKLSINKGEGIADDAKFGKVYAVKANDKLPENIFPEIKVSDEKEYRNPRWTDKDDTRFNSLDEIKAIPMSPADLEYIAKADKIQKQDWTDIVGFDKDSISEISIKEQPKLTYKDGENLDLTDLVVTLKDKNGMEVYVPFKDFKEYEITTDKVDGESLSHKDDNDKPVKVSVSDKSANTNPLVIEQKDMDKYEPKVTPIVKPNGEPTTEDEVKKAVEVPNYPKDSEEQPKILIDPDQKLPDGKTAGTFNINVTVKYPDGTEDHVEVPVIVNDPTKKENEIYEPKVTPIVKPNGEPTTNDDVKKAVEVPGYPKDAEKQPEISVDPGQKLPDGKTAGTFNIDVTVKYPDGSEDHVKVPVTVKEKVTPTDPIIITVTPGVEFITPEVLDPSNCAVKPWLVVKKDKGITYIVTLEDGTEVKPDKDGVYRYEYGQIVKVKAIAKDGYKFSADAVTEWSYKAPKPAVCEMKDEKPQVDNKPNGQNPNTSDSGVKVSVLAFAMSMVALFAVRKKRKENM